MFHTLSTSLHFFFLIKSNEPDERLSNHLNTINEKIYLETQCSIHFLVSYIFFVSSFFFFEIKYNNFEPDERLSDHSNKKNDKLPISSKKQ